MKKYVVFILAMACLLSIAGCGLVNKTGIIRPAGGYDGADAVTHAETTADDRMVVVDGRLYRATGAESSAGGRCGVMDGEISSSVRAGETPTADDQSNFGTGYGYQIASENTIDVFIDGKWMVFEQTP